MKLTRSKVELQTWSFSHNAIMLVRNIENNTHSQASRFTETNLIYTTA